MTALEDLNLRERSSSLLKDMVRASFVSGDGRKDHENFHTLRLASGGWKQHEMSQSIVILVGGGRSAGKVSVVEVAPLDGDNVLTIPVAAHCLLGDQSPSQVARGAGGDGRAG